MAEEEASEEEAGQSEEENIVASLEALTTTGADNSNDDDDDDDDDDADLFGPPPPREDCPICMLRLPFEPCDTQYSTCCGKVICSGCWLENLRVINVTNKKNARLDQEQGRAERPPLIDSCPFCREPPPNTDIISLLRLEKRMELNDALAFFNMGCRYREGDGVTKDECKAFELFLRSAELGCACACNEVAVHYHLGQGVEKDEEKDRMYLEKAAKAGFAHNLGVLEYKNGKIDKASRHWLMSAELGDQTSLDALKFMYKEGNVSKDEFAQALRSFQAASDEERSEERNRCAAIKAWRAARKTRTSR